MAPKHIVVSRPSAALKFSGHAVQPRLGGEYTASKPLSTRAANVAVQPPWCGVRSDKATADRTRSPLRYSHASMEYSAANTCTVVQPRRSRVLDRQSASSLPRNQPRYNERMQEYTAARLFDETSLTKPRAGTSRAKCWWPRMMAQ